MSDVTNGVFIATHKAGLPGEVLPEVVVVQVVVQAAQSADYPPFAQLCQVQPRYMIRGYIRAQYITIKSEL